MLNNSDFTFVLLRVRIRIDRRLPDRFAVYNLIKQKFEPAFRMASGCSGAHCARCLSSECAYRHAFGRALSADPVAVKRYQKPSVPFVFSFPLSSPVHPGTEYYFNLLLLGSAANFLSVYSAAIKRVFEGSEAPSAGAIVVGVDSYDYSGNCREINHWPELFPQVQLLSLRGLEAASCLSVSELSLIIETPLRVVQDGIPLLRLSFSTFIRPLMRRTSSLAYYYGGVEMDYDFTSLSRQSESVVINTSDLSWESWGSSGRLGGFVGRVRFSGSLADFHPFLLLGEYVHLGKGASFGLGSYRLENTFTES